MFIILQKPQSNGQPVAVAQEEIKVAEAVSNPSPPIKTEKVQYTLRELETVLSCLWAELAQVLFVFFLRALHAVNG